MRYCMVKHAISDVNAQKNNVEWAKKNYKKNVANHMQKLVFNKKKYNDPEFQLFVFLFESAKKQIGQ